MACVGEDGLVFTLPAFSPNGSLLALGDSKGHLRLGESTINLPQGNSLSALAFRPGREILAAGSEDGTLALIDILHESLIRERLVQDGFVNGLVFSPEGDSLYLAGADSQITQLDFDWLLRIPTGAGPESPLPVAAIRQTFTGHQDVVTSLHISADGARLLSASFDGTARVWDVVRAETILILSGQDGRVWSAAFDPQKDRIATGGEDGSVIMWDAVTGEALFSPGVVPEGVFRLAFSADGRLLAASGLNGTVRVYVLPVDDLVRLAHQRLVRGMTLAECRQYLHLAACP
jgi:WD40 repeat protein